MTEFNNKILVKNIYKLSKEKNIKLSEVENQCGVSQGYLSRLAREDNNAIPGIDFVSKVSSIFAISIETLINVDLEKASPTEQYIIYFLEKLIIDTKNIKCDWIEETAEELNNMEYDENGYINDPLFSYERFKREDESGYTEDVFGIIFKSKSFAFNTCINGNCYSLRLKNDRWLRLMDICRDVHHANDVNSFAIELWVCGGSKPNEFICKNTKDSPLTPVVENLMMIAREFCSHPRVSKDLSYIIDAYMKDDIDDDPQSDEIELPF